MFKKIFEKDKEQIVTGIGVNSTHLQYACIKKNVTQHTIVDAGKYCLEDLPLAFEYLRKNMSIYPCRIALPHAVLTLKTFIFSDFFIDQDIENFLLINAESYFGDKADSINFDYEFLDQSKTKVRVIAGKKECIERWRNKFTQYGLLLSTVSSDVLALESFLMHYQKLNEEKIYGAFLLRGEDLLELVLINKRIQFIRTTLIAEERTAFFHQEISRFLREYESSTHFIEAVTHFIFLGFKKEIITSLNEYFPKIEIINNSITECADNFSYIPLGIALHA